MKMRLGYIVEARKELLEKLQSEGSDLYEYFDESHVVATEEHEYEDAFEGYKKSIIASAKNSESIIFTITNPADGDFATAGNGTMIALEAESREQVDLLYNKGLEMGGRDEGLPGERPGGYYCAYVRDLDGNKLNFHVKPNVT